MAYGKIEYNERGEPKCEICGLFFKRVTAHSRQIHNVNAKYYKKMFGLDSKKGVCSQESSEKTREKTFINYDKCIGGNLLLNGVKSRFKEGEGKEKYISEQTKIMLRERLNNIQKSKVKNHDSKD